MFLFGGEGLNGTVFDDLWRFDMENVQWSEQKQADLVGLVAEKQNQTGALPGKSHSHSLLSIQGQLVLVTEN